MARGIPRVSVGPDRQCEYMLCGKTYTPHHPKQRFCCRAHKDKQKMLCRAVITIDRKAGTITFKIGGLDVRPTSPGGVGQ
jgi:hypothetical protein